MVNRTIERARQEYADMPGLRLTVRQAERLFGVDQPVCRAALDALVTTHFLRVESDGTYSHRPGPSDELD